MFAGMIRERIAIGAAVIGISLTVYQVVVIAQPVVPGFSQCCHQDINGEERCHDICLPGQTCCTMPHFTIQGAWVNLAGACCSPGQDCWASWTLNNEVYVWCGTLGQNPGGPSGPGGPGPL